MEDMAIALREDVEQIVLSLGSDFAITYDQLRDNAKNNEVNTDLVRELHSGHPLSRYVL